MMLRTLRILLDFLKGKGLLRGKRTSGRVTSRLNFLKFKEISTSITSLICYTRFKECSTNTKREMWNYGRFDLREGLLHSQSNCKWINKQWARAKWKFGAIWRRSSMSNFLLSITYKPFTRIYTTLDRLVVWRFISIHFKNL